MNKFAHLILFLGLILLSPFSTHFAAAQATRTWVSGVGDDANPCSRTAPCKTFAGAISKTAAGGEISVLDPGGFGAVTITKSITLSGAGNSSSILVAGTNGITINVGQTDVVTLTGLELEGISGSGASPGLSGVKMVSPGRLQIVNCQIRDFSVAGVEIVPASGTAKAVIDNTQIINATTGIISDATNGTTLAVVSKSSLTANGRAGAEAIGANGRVLLSDSLVTGNLTGLLSTSGGGIISMGNNTLANNNTQGTISFLAKLQ